MPLPPFRDHRIALADASEHARRHRQASPPGAEKAGFFFRQLLDEMLAQPGCSGIRFYHGRDGKNQPSLILVGVDANGNDLTGGTLMDLHYPCPPVCSDGSALNG